MVNIIFFYFSLRSLALCLKDKYLKQGIELVGCELATEGAVNGVFSKKVSFIDVFTSTDRI